MVVSEDEHENKKQCNNNDNVTDIESRAPDGGWGYMVALAMVIVFVTCFGPFSCWAIIFKDVLEETDKPGTFTTLLNSVFMISSSIAGLLTDFLLRKYSMRLVGVIGAFIFSITNISLAFIQKASDMAIIYTIQGMGFGLIINICNVNFNAYFVKKRAKVMSATQVIVGIGVMIYPMAIEAIMEKYGFRGTCLLLGGFSLHCVVGMVMMHPVKWYLKDPPVISDISEKLHLEEDGKSVPLLKEKDKEIKSFSIPELRTVRDLDSQRLSALSASSMTNLVTGIGPIEFRKPSLKVTEEETGVEATHFSCRKILSEVFDKELLHDRKFMNAVLGMSFVANCDYIYSTLLPLMMVNSGLTTADATLAVTVSAFTELVSRIFLALFTAFFQVREKYLYFINMILMGIVKTTYMLFQNSFIGAMTNIAIIGMIRSWLMVLQALIIVEDMKVEKFAAAYGIYNVVGGVICVFLGPIVGMIKDWTDSYDICQLILIGINFIFVFLWALEFVVERKENKGKRRQTIEDSKG